MLIQQKDSLEQAFNKVHDQLKRAGVDTRHEFRSFSVATINESEKIIPKSRMVVLRSFSDNWTFEFYTDHRSSKVEQIKNNPFISALFWDSSKRVQVRIEADAIIHNQDEFSVNRWKYVQGDAQKAYTSVPAPGTPIDAPEDAHEWPISYSSDHFSVVVCSAARIEALQISGMEHFAFDSHRDATTGEWLGEWIAP